MYAGSLHERIALDNAHNVACSTDKLMALTVHQAGAAPGCEAQKWVSRGRTGQGGMRKVACVGGLAQATDSELKTLCPLAPPSMVRRRGNMKLHSNAPSVSPIIVQYEIAKKDVWRYHEASNAQCRLGS